jgi:hypothetical protein
MKMGIRIRFLSRSVTAWIAALALIGGQTALADSVFHSAIAAIPALGRPELESYGRTFTDREIENMAVEVHRLTELKGGATYNLTEGSLLGKPRFAVSVFPTKEVQIKGLPTVAQIADFMKKYRSYLGTSRYSVGTWVHEGVTYLDLSVTTPNRGIAEDLARRHGQEGIYDLKNKRTILAKEFGK